MKTVAIASGRCVPALVQGTWSIGENKVAPAGEIATLGLGLHPGITLIDTAETHSEGKAEELIGEAIAGRRALALMRDREFQWEDESWPPSACDVRAILRSSCSTTSTRAKPACSPRMRRPASISPPASFR